MTAALIVGAFAGFGVMLVGNAFVRRATPLALALEQLHDDTTADGTAATWTSRLLGQSWQSTGFGTRIIEKVQRDLFITRTTPAEHLAQRVLFAGIGMLWAPATAALIEFGGVSVAWAIPAWTSLALAAIGFLYPSVALRSKARAQRQTFRHAFSSFLDLVSVSLSGGKGIEGALHDGSNAGDGWAFEYLQDALQRSQLMGETPWKGLARLGDELDVPELKELAASAQLGGAEGARVRSSIAAKARALRLRGLADVEAAAQSASEKMSLPIVGLMVGFIVFLGYPAIIQVVNGL